MGGGHRSTTADLVAEGRTLVPWHLLMDVTDEVSTSRDASALAHFDAVEQQLPPLSRIVEKAVRPEATVLVASPPESGP